MLPLSGGQVNGDKYAVVCGPPLYDYFTGECSSVEILYPLNGSLLIFPDHTVNLTWSITEDADCYYRIDSGLWNQHNCTIGNNSQMVTLPEGTPTIYVNATTSGCSSVDEITVTVVYGGDMTTSGRALILFLILALYLLFLDEDTPRKKKEKPYAQRASRR
jgi:hypothetical protein